MEEVAITNIIKADYVEKVDKWIVELGVKGESKKTAWLTESQMINLENSFARTEKGWSSKKVQIYAVYNEKGYYAYSKVIYNGNRPKVFSPPTTRDLSDLSEDLTEHFADEYDKPYFYYLMGKYFAERHYKRIMPYLYNDNNMKWKVLVSSGYAIGFIGYKETAGRVSIEYCFTDANNLADEKELIEQVLSEYDEKYIYIILEKKFEIENYIELGFKENTDKSTVNYIYLEKRVINE